MMTVKEVSNISGVSIRTLHHYDAIGLLKPTQITESNYRLYDEDALERLQLILLFKEFGFPLKEIGNILDAPDFDRNRALEQQIELLNLRKEHLENLINFARGIKLTGVRYLDFTAFDTKKIDDYVVQAKLTYGKTEAYKEFEQKSKDRSAETENEIASGLMDIFRRIGAHQNEAPDDKSVQALVEELREFITHNYYKCTVPILKCLGDMYAGGGTMTENIDNAGGAGTGAFAKAAIDIYCQING